MEAHILKAKKKELKEKASKKGDIMYKGVASLKDPYDRIKRNKGEISKNNYTLKEVQESKKQKHAE
eukprot:CAMPEP_0202959034 /NCGR_PEP_ID=MMETSP1396-20130829/3298_1 /ASSEMBLY_ACC=CAM_ASM_000872 /TAXON_ID= /ORGANISM="Pseudokeronopsis sp., Strain Brazil" /LENGTH=65 /DNA_ID=CAMNT_0049677397 /DNA_START=529 /DNA_END=723 /DNA_ORIENTATION=-